VCEDSNPCDEADDEPYGRSKSLPIFDGDRRLPSAEPGELKVKNTFIHMDQDAQPDLPQRSISAPHIVASGPKALAVTSSEERDLSIGSKEHGSGTCRPCAWFWKPQGCMNGADCRHCHLCPPGEIKRRRKVKFSTMRSERSEPLSEEKTSPCNQEGSEDQQGSGPDQ